MKLPHSVQLLQRVLNTSDVFLKLNTADRGTLFMLAKPRIVAAGESLFVEGDPKTDEVMLIVEGDFEVMTRGGVTVEDTRSAPEFIGEVGPATKSFRTRTVRAKSTLQLLSWSIVAIQRESPEVAERFLDAIEDRAFSRVAQDLQQPD